MKVISVFHSNSFTLHFLGHEKTLSFLQTLKKPSARYNSQPVIFQIGFFFPDQNYNGTITGAYCAIQANSYEDTSRLD